MLDQITCLREACDALGLEYQALDREQNLTVVKVGGRNRIFQLSRTPVLNDAAAGVCRDKAHAHALLEGVIDMPRSRSYLDPDTKPEYRRYVEFPDHEAMADDMERRFGYPMVIKPNQGSKGLKVRLCADRGELLAAVDAIFSGADRHYDYVLLAQTRIVAAAEYRVVAVPGEVLLAYRRCGAEIGFGARYWERSGGQPELIRDPARLERFQAFLEPVWDRMDLSYCGFDVLEDGDGKFWLLELNSQPRFKNLLEAGERAAVVHVYRRLLSRMLEAERAPGNAD